MEGGEEIITDAMIEAGISQIQEFRCGLDSHRELAQQVYRAMEVARHCAYDKWSPHIPQGAGGDRVKVKDIKSSRLVLDDHFMVIYAVASDIDGPTKIGVTSNLQERLIGLQCGSWMPLSVYGFRLAMMESTSGQYPTFARAALAGARCIEAEVHRVLKEMDLHIMGEWFDISAPDAIRVMDKCGKKRGVRTVSLEQVASVMMDDGLDRAMAKIQRKIIGSMAAAATYVAEHQPHRLTGAAS